MYVPMSLSQPLKLMKEKYLLYCIYAFTCKYSRKHVRNKGSKIIGSQSLAHWKPEILINYVHKLVFSCLLLKWNNIQAMLEHNSLG